MEYKGNTLYPNTQNVDPALDFGSESLDKPENFSFGFTDLRVNGKTNPPNSKEILWSRA